uniref:Dynactin subunit 1 n=1 Tax=Ditylenchus dipsaci TaxID=166011 RepID=A0A915DLA8_9BILA
MSTLKIGDLVDTEKGSGAVAYFGETEFSEGTWVGIVLDEPKGKNNGTVKGVSYFACKENHGIFIQKDKVRLKQSTPRSKLQAPSSSMRPPSALRKPSTARTTPGSTPKMTPSSSVEKLDRQKSFGNRVLQQQSTLPSKIPESHLPEPVTRRLSKVASSIDSASSEHSIVRERAHKIDENTPMTSSVYKLPETTTPTGSGADNVEIDFLKKEIKDLNEKLDTLRAKRKEDQEKLKEYERNKIQLQTLQVFKTEMSHAHSALKKEKEEMQKKMEELQAQHEENSDLNRLLEQLELTALDKEMAEEKAEILQTEVETLESKCQELETALAMMKSDLQRGIPMGGDGTVSNSVELKQLEQQNERMKEAVLLLRDGFARSQAEINNLKKDVELAQLERDELSSLCEKLEQELDAAKESVNTFRDQVDAAMGSEQMIATLTDKNLDLEDKIKALEEDVSELEVLRSMDEEIIESQKDAEKELKQDMEQQFVKISELKRQLQEYDRRAEDFERVILKFRQKNADLNEEIQQLKDEILIYKSEQESGDSDHCHSLKTVNLNRTFAEIVEAELKSIELEYFRQHVSFLKSFLPDNFTKAGGDNDFKLLNLKYPPVPNGIRREHITLSHKAEQWAHVKKFSYSLHALNAILKKFDAVSRNCSVERLTRLAIQQLEFTGQERNLDQYFELLKQNRLDENTSVDNLDRIVNFFQKVFATNLSAENYNARDALKNTIVQLKEGLAWIQFNCQRLKYFLQPLDGEIESCEFGKQITTFVKVLTECESLAIRSLNRIPAENDLMLSSETNDKIMSAVAALEKTAKAIHNTCSFAASQLTTIDVEGFSSSQLKEMLHSSVEKLVGPTDSSKAGAVITESIEVVKTFLFEVSECLENSSMEIPPTQANNFPPLLERAHTRKNDAVEAEGLRWQISKKDEEILKLQKLIRAKEGDISTLKLRLEMADKQMETPAKDFVKQKTDYEKTLEQLQKKLEQAEQDREKERERARDFSKKALFANMTQNILGNAAGGTSPLTPPIVPTMVNFGQEMVSMERELTTTLNDLKWAEQRIRLLEHKNSTHIMSSLEPINPPDSVCGIYSLKHRSLKSEDEAELDKMLKETESLMTESNLYLIEPLEHKQKEAFRNKVVYINDRIESLKFRFHRFWSRTHPDEEYPRLVKSLIAQHTASNVNTDKHKTMKSEQKCKSILSKWNKDLAEKENWYGGMLNKGVA